ncbi:sensor histidine kinase [Deferrisoma camini]|uniref:sensor histidine kinase n=1 Tax=Deferrisoma camini TaxID=1035120 RepID=UPI00046CDCEB|nr:ATP-binding protein [Deferrisoma camini]
MLVNDPRKDFWIKVGAVAVLVFGVSLLHYGTTTARPLLHDVYRRLYYIPVGLAAVWFGLRGGLAVSGVVAAIYVPHIIIYWNDMGRELWNRVMEVGLYFVFSGLVGFFADRDRAYRRRLQMANERLERSYEELRRQADTLLQVEEQLRRADRLSAIGQLAAAVTHEIRNPLGAIKGTAEILRDEFPSGHPKAEFLEILLKETDRLNQVVEEFLGYARPGSTEEGEAVDLAQVARQVVGFLSTPARKAGVTVSLEADEPVRVGGRPAQLKQVLLNLVLNAVQATPPGRRVIVRVGSCDGRVLGPEFRQVAGRVAHLCVEDEGPGLPRGEEQRVFEPFFTTKEEGTGLGLAISRKIAEAHGGTLVAENRPEGGARFVLTLPALEEADG